MVTALLSLILDQPVRRRLGMTGEITLSGRVLPIGGLKEKLLAAHRGGLDTVVVPARNKPDLDEVPAEVRDELEVVFADRIEDVIAVALPEALPPPAPRKKTAAARKKKSAPKKTTTTKRPAANRKARPRVASKPTKRKSAATRRKQKVR